MRIVPLITRIFFVYGLFVLPCLLFPGILVAQNKLPDHIISVKLEQKLHVTQPDKKIRVIVSCKGEDLPAEIKKAGSDIKKLRFENKISFYSMALPAKTLVSSVSRIPEILFIEDGSRIPKEELIVGNLDLSVNNINNLHRQFTQLTGAGTTVSIKENRPDTTDIDFKNRFLTTGLSSTNESSHASIMATMIAGGGNSWHLGKGVAWGSTISSSDFANLLPDDNASYQQYNISVQNHSYGVGIENYYGADASAFDASAIDNPSLVHIFSSGNSGSSASDAGVYTGITGFANLTGSFKMAKNILTVGATDSFHLIAALSSKGPAFDGRVKPELVAFGEDGSSGAAALVSGAALVIQQQYKQLTGSLPANALTRAILLNSADDAGNPELDYSYGFGNMNALNAVKTIQAGRYFKGNVANRDSQQYSVTVPAGVKKLKVTLTWNDPPASPNAVKTLVNDLDLMLVNSENGENWEPWVLNSFPNADSLQQSATRKRDSLNNIEQVTIDNPAAAIYQFKVSGFNVTGSPQDFYIAYQFDSSDVFEWQFPTKNDFIFSSSVNTIRWASSFRDTTGSLEYSVNNGTSWQLINNAINLSNGFYQWQAPVGIQKALLRMTIGKNQFFSDTCTISQRTTTGVGFNCPDSLLIYWDKLPGVNSYDVYTLGDKYLEPLVKTTADFLVLSKTANKSLYYTVAPVIDNIEGVKSYTFNYTLQGVECYFKTFFALLENNTVRLQLSLGTVYNINKIVFEKYDGRNFLPIQQLTTINSTDLSFIDSSLKNGSNIYRVKLELTGGSAIYSSIETVYNFSASDYIIYPNPVNQNQLLRVLVNDPSPSVTLQVFNNTGQKVAEYIISDIVTDIATAKFSKGIYFFRFIKEGSKDQISRVIVL